MYGDTELMRRRVSALRDQGADVRTLADELMARVEALGWTGRAADAMSERVVERAHHLRAAAESHVGAADALADHVEAVEAAIDEIGQVETRVTAMVTDARARIAAIEASGVDGAPAVTPHPADDILASFVAPPPGHRDWLDVEVPGWER